MNESTISIPFPATPATFDLAELISLAQSSLERLVELIREFLAAPTTPQATDSFENNLAETLRKLGRELSAWTYNHVEPPAPSAAAERIEFQKEQYRQRGKSSNRGGIGTRFGTIRLERLRYEPVEKGQPSIFPLEINLGLEAGNASPALAERVGELASSCTQTELLLILKRDHEVHWSVKTLCKVTASYSAGMIPHFHAAQVKQILSWLRQGEASRGRHKVVLAVGRDGCMLPIRGEKTYKEGAVATISVYDRRRKRLGTVYLGRMPEPGQGTLSERLTRLIEDVLSGWEGPLPRLAYVTDAGFHPTHYYETVLAWMPDRRHPGKYLEWLWIVDFYHAAEYIGELARALFGEAKSTHAWARKMCRWLKHKPNGVYRVLHSAAKHHSERVLTKKEQKAYQAAYGYLKRHREFMEYAEYRRRGLPIGSGVTEAACKTVFTQRFKQSGMSWGKDDQGNAQHILDLRVIRLSGVWDQVHQSYLASKPLAPQATESHFVNLKRKKVA